MGEMKTFVGFRSNRFPPYDGEEAQINPGIWGRRLADYMVAKLAARGIQAREPLPEDWGWYVPVEIDGAAAEAGRSGGRNIVGGSGYTRDFLARSVTSRWNRVLRSTMG